MLDRRLVAAALAETQDLPESDRGQDVAFARAVSSSLRLEGIDVSPEQVLEASKAIPDSQ
ncbi:MAG TPA: hypothetical protein VGG89_14430 [Candidatus Baltobacteraceae bacterium]|jgi:hypothetical protein